MPNLPTLRDWIATLDEEELAELLAAHPTVQRGAQGLDLDALADRLAHPATMTTALFALPLPLLQVVETTAALGPGATVDRLCALLDAGDGDTERHAADVRGWLDQARSRGLVWPDGERLHVNPGIGAVVPSPLGLGRPVKESLAEVTVETVRSVARSLGLPNAGRKDDLVERVAGVLADPVAVRQRMAAAPEDVLPILSDTVNRALSRARPLAAPYLDDDEADLDDYAEWSRIYQESLTLRSWMVAAGLALPTPSWRSYSSTVDIPTEVYLALAPPGFGFPFAPRQPRVASVPVPEEQVGRSAAAAASDFLATAMAVLEGLARRPLTAVKAGGIGARELTRHAKAVGTESSGVRLSLSLAARTGLLAVTSSGELTTVDEFDEWRRRRPAERAADLGTAWLMEFVPPTLDRDADDKAVPLLGPDPRRSSLPLGLVLCSLVAELPGHGILDPAQLMDVVTWRQPLSETPPGAPARSWAEAHQLGLLADGAVTPLGQALIAGDRERAVAALDAMLPEVSAHALIGSDQTVLVPGSPDPAVVDVLDVVATRETRGAANTWRITAESVRHALDSGYAVEDLIAALEAISGKDLPQALHYVMQDVARKHGHLRVQSAACAILSEDQALLAEVVATRGLRKLGLQLVAPTVALATQPAEAVLSSLRSAGYLPLMADGGAPAVELRRLPGLGRPAPEGGSGRG